jgi:hypothetical protein
MRLRLVGDRPGEPIVDGGTPQFEPSIEVRRRQWEAVMQILMNAHRISAVDVGVQQDLLPEIANDRKVRIYIHMCDIGEDVTQLAISEG